jgi:hypothetical protein
MQSIALKPDENSNHSLCKSRFISIHYKHTDGITTKKRLSLRNGAKIYVQLHNCNRIRFVLLARAGRNLTTQSMSSKNKKDPIHVGLHPAESFRCKRPPTSTTPSHLHLRNGHVRGGRDRCEVNGSRGHGESGGDRSNGKRMGTNLCLRWGAALRRALLPRSLSAIGWPAASLMSRRRCCWEGGGASESVTVAEGPELGAVVQVVFSTPPSWPTKGPNSPPTQDNVDHYCPGYTLTVNYTISCFEKRFSHSRKHISDLDHESDLPTL